MTYQRRRRHRLTGIVLLLPVAVWAVTGAFFLLRPPFVEAYERIPVFERPLPEEITIAVQPGWTEVRTLRSVLGHHLLAKTEEGWVHFDAATNEPWPLPSAQDLRRLLEDAFPFRPDRYGNVLRIEGTKAFTDTGVEIDIDWSTLSIRQSGRDTRWIDRIYELHYLRWTGVRWIDRIVGVGGLALLFFLAWTGGRMAFRREGRSKGRRGSASAS